MALTKVSRGLLSTSIVDNGNATAITIDSSENVGIGTSSPSTKLHLGGTAPLDSIIRQDSTVSGTNWEIGERAAGKWQIWEDDSDSVVATFMSSGNVGIGTSSPSASKFSSTPDGVLNVSGNKPVVYLTEEDETDSNVWMGLSNEVGIIGNTGDGIAFRTGASTATERVRIDSSGHTMFATTDDAPGAGNTQSGVAIRGGSDNRSFFSASSNYAMHLNRNTNDGEILYFAKEGTAVGSIGTNAATMYVSAPQAGGMKYSYLNSTNAVMLPVTTTGANADGLHDLGLSAARFRDLYLSGKSIVGSGSFDGGGVIHNYGSDGNSRSWWAKTDTHGYGDFAIRQSTTQTGSTYQTRLLIDSAGNLLVGKSVSSSSITGMLIGSNGRFDAIRDGGYVGYFNRLSSDGDIAIFAKNGTTVGSIGANGGVVYVTGPVAGGLKYSYYDSTHASIFPCTTTGGIADDVHDLGYSGSRFNDIYATNGTIQTSDRNEKQDIAELSDAEQRVAVAAKGLLRKFRWKDSVAEKGDEARTHFGIIAQDLQDAFTAEGLDAGDYAMFISSTWTDEETNEEKTRMGVRYSELLAFIIAAI